MSEKEPDIFDRLKNSDEDGTGRFSSLDFFATPGKSAYWVLLAIVGSILFVVFKEFIFGYKFYLFKGVGTDSVDALYPYLYNAAKTFPAHGLPTWSFNYGMGQNTFPFFLRDPFDLILYFAGREHIATGILWVELLKIILTSAIVYKYLETLKLQSLTAITGSLYFSFCGYMIIGSVWHFFSFEVMNMALLLLAFEFLFQRDKWWLFPLPFFFIGATIPLNGYFFGIFLISYAIFRLIQTDKFTFQFAGKLALKMMILGTIGLLASGPFLLENTAVLFQNPRVGGHSSIAHQLMKYPMRGRANLDKIGAALLRFFANDITGTPDNFKGWHNTFEAPQFWIGLPTLLLFPQFFTGLKRNKKVILVGLLVLWLVPIFFPWWRLAFWLFTGNYFRVFSFLMCLAIWIPSLFALDKLIRDGKLNLTLLGFTLFVLVLLLFFPWFGNNDVVYRPVQMLALMFLLIHSCILYLLHHGKEKVMYQWLFLLAVVAETGMLTHTTVTNWIAVVPQDMEAHKYYQDYTKDALKIIHQRDSSFYRIDKNYYSSPGSYFTYNDGLLQDYNGTSSYGSFNQLNYINFLQTCGLSDPNNEVESRWSKGLNYHPVFESQNRVKYFFVKKTLNPEWYLIADSLFKTGDVTVYRNRLCIPFGFTTTDFMKMSNFEKLSVNQKAMMVNRAVVVADKNVGELADFHEVSISDTLADSNASFPIVQQVAALEDSRKIFLQDTLRVTEFNDEKIAGSINAQKKELLYLSIPFDKSWKLYVDGKYTPILILNGGMSGAILDKGLHSIKLEYSLYYLKTGIFLALLGIGIWIFIYRRDRKLKVIAPQN